MLSVNAMCKGFLDLMKEVDRQYQVPLWKSELRQVDYYASTTDLWSSCTTEPYMSYTVHFLTNDFELKTRCLEVAYFPESHTSENMASTLREVLANWSLQ